MDDILFRAILALDAYNRGYAPGIASLGGGVGAQIGAASIVAQSDVRPNSPAFNAGFYAVAYEVGGEKIISYRGTDRFSFLTNNGPQGPGDLGTDAALVLGSGTTTQPA